MLSRRQLLKASGSAALRRGVPRRRRSARARRRAKPCSASPPTRSRPTRTTGGRSSQAFTLDRTIVNLNNGGCCPSPRVVHEAFKRYLDLSNQAPVYHMWQVLEPNIESRQAPARGGVRLRCRGARHHQERQRGPADRAARRRSPRRRRGGHHQPGLRAHARHLGAARAPRRDPPVEDLVSGAAEVAGRPRRSAARRDHAGDPRPALLPHHEPDRTDLSRCGGSATRRGAAASRPSSTAPTPSRTSPTRPRISAATTTAPACTSGCSRRSARAFSTCGARTSRRCGR